jgi:dTDP-glucose 4,6-dehydratase
MLVRSYFHTFGLNVVTTNCSNNYGPRQHREKLIPTIIRTALASQAIPIYGDGQNIRDWLYVADHCDAIYTVLHHGKAGEIYLVGSRNEWTNLRIAHTICDILDRETPLKNGKSYRELIAFVADRPGHDLRYAIDPTKLETELNWESKTPFNVGLNDTVKWYLNQ